MLQVKFDLRLHVQFLFNLLRLIPIFFVSLSPDYSWIIILD